MAILASEPTQANNPVRNPKYRLVRALIFAIAIAALASPIYVAIRGSGYLNQPPPPFWGVTLAKANTGTGKGVATSFGGC